MKILLVENNKGVRDSWLEMLQQSGQHSVTAVGGRTAFPPQRVLNEAFDLAVVDRRLLRDTDGNDLSGERYAAQLCAAGVPVLLLTAHLPSGSRSFRLLRRGELTGIANKVNSSSVRKWIDEFTHTRAFPNGIAEFDWGRLRNRRDIEEVEELFRRLVPPCASSVQIEALPGGHGGAQVAKLNVAYGDAMVPDVVVVKFGSRGTISSEQIRYDRLVSLLPDGAAANLRWRAETEHLGAIAYSLVSNSIEDGKQLGPSTSSVSWDQRRKALECLFYVSLNRWYESYRAGAHRYPDYPKEPLLQHYAGRGGLWYDDIGSLDEIGIPPTDLDMHDMFRYEEETDRWIFPSVNPEYGNAFANPVSWAKQQGARRLVLEQRCPCHGDLHCKNIFVLPDLSPRLIDFGRTDLGHVFRDFAAIEASIRMTCVTSEDEDLLARGEFYTSNVTTLGEYIDSHSFGQATDIGEAILTTVQIRRAAVDASGDCSKSGFQQYSFALVMHLLKYASGEADELARGALKKKRRLRVWRAMYAAAQTAARAVTVATSKRTAPQAN